MAVFKRGKNYYIEWRVAGRKRRKAVGPNKKLAELALAKIKVEIAEGRHLDKVKSRATTFDQLAERYMAWAKVNKLSADRDQRSIVVLSRWFGGKKLHHINPWDIERYKAERKGEVSGSTVSRGSMYRMGFRGKSPAAIAHVGISSCLI